MNEGQIRERLRLAVGEARYPAYLLSRVEARLKHAAPEQSPRASLRRSQSRWPARIGRTGSLVAAMLVVLLIAALVVGVNAWRNGDLLHTRLAPAVQDPTIKQYQAMVAADEKRVVTSQSQNCFTLSDGCPAAAAVLVAAAQQWLDDLNRSQPPARFAYVDGQMRRHIALLISDLNAAVAAYRARDQVGMNNGINAAMSDRDAFDIEVSDITLSSQGTIPTYTSAVGVDRANLLACALCQQLVSQNNVSCQASHTPSCVEEIAATRLQVEILQGDLVRVLAPASLAAKDARLQADLSTADLALDAMASAISAGDAAGLQAGHDALRRALGRVDFDAANIVGSN